MRQLLSILLIGIFLLHAWSFSAIYLGFVLHHGYIAKELCENRSRPGLHCCGKCYLKKEFKKQETDNNHPLNIKSSAEITLFQDQHPVLTIDNSYKEVYSFAFYHGHSSDPRLKAIFHPPCA